jgi:hypothetical protein
MRLTSRHKLDDACLNANMRVVRRRQHQGSVRLAMVLNDAFDQKYRRPSVPMP